MDLETLPRQISRTQYFTLGIARSFTISSDGNRIVYLRTRGGEDRVSCLWLLEHGVEQTLVDPVTLSGGETVSVSEQTRRARTHEFSTGIVTYSTDQEVRVVAFVLNGQLWVVGLDGESPRMISTFGSAFDPHFDPTGRRIAYVSEGSLRVVDVFSGEDWELARPDTPDVSYGVAEHVAAEEMHRLRGFWWAPDGERLLAARVDDSLVQRWWISDPANPQNSPRSIRYPVAGTDNSEVALYIFRLNGERTQVVWDHVSFEYLVSAAWDIHGPLLNVESRDQRTSQILSVDSNSGETTVLHEQSGFPWIHMTIGVPVRTESGVLVRVADVESSRRLVFDGRVVTADQVQVREVLGVDGENVLFTASDDPTEVHVWSYSPDFGVSQLTQEPGVHGGCANGQTRVLISDTEFGHSVRVSRDGSDDCEIQTFAAEPVVQLRISWLSLGAREIRTALILPTWYEPGHGKLPILMCPYGGPSLQLVTRARHFYFLEAQWFAESGFAVIIADGSGTPGRGPDWEHEVFGDTLSTVIEDQVTVLKEIVERFPDMDSEKVAIRGWSYGGTLAAAAVIRRPEIFHAAISGAAPSDQTLYDTYFKERYLGHPSQFPENYVRSSPIHEAALLSRPLLLIHGMADDNVVVAHSLRMSSALLNAGRPHEVLPLSNSGHDPTDEMTISNLLFHELEFLQRSLHIDPR